MDYQQSGKILVVDDTESNIDVILDSLQDNYDLTVATNGYDALEIIAEEIPDLILLDVMMPGINGYEVCQKLKLDDTTKDIPIIFLTAVKDITDKTKAFELGAVDYITKPFDVMELKARVKTHLELKFAKKMLFDQNRFLEEMVRKRTEELYKTQAATIYSLAALAETRDTETGEHIKRTQYYIKTLCLGLRNMGIYTDYLDDKTISMLFDSSPLHDIGKVGVPDNILLKPGKLTNEEFEIMKLHTVYGKNALEIAEKELGSNSFLSLAKEIAFTHHEKWDGSGYPLGLKESEIPISGRLMALADVYDALISSRPYKKAFSHEEAKDIIVKGSGSHFDPDVVKAFLNYEKDFILIKDKYITSKNPSQKKNTEVDS